jgi:hypothetical protein
MTIRKRLKRLEDKARRLPVAAEDRWEDVRDEDWLELFAAWGEQGHFSAEPDFAAALDFYRDAVQHAKRQIDPPFDPPADFMPNMTDLPHLRFRNWRDVVRFPDVHAGWDWLMEMLCRVQQNIPPVSVSEFAELREWFQANEARLYQLSAPSVLLDVGEGKFLSLTDLRYGLHRGVRASGSGTLAEDIRRLKAHYGGGPT